MIRDGIAQDGAILEAVTDIALLQFDGAPRVTVDVGQQLIGEGLRVLRQEFPDQGDAKADMVGLIAGNVAELLGAALEEAESR